MAKWLRVAATRQSDQNQPSSTWATIRRPICWSRTRSQSLSPSMKSTVGVVTAAALWAAAGANPPPLEISTRTTHHLHTTCNEISCDESESVAGTGASPLTVLRQLPSDTRRGTLMPTRCRRDLLGSTPKGGNDVKVPGFTAEVSLYRTSKAYRLVATQTRQSGPYVLPQLAINCSGTEGEKCYCPTGCKQKTNGTCCCTADKHCFMSGGGGVIDPFISLDRSEGLFLVSRTAGYVARSGKGRVRAYSKRAREAAGPDGGDRWHGRSHRRARGRSCCA